MKNIRASQKAVAECRKIEFNGRVTSKGRKAIPLCRSPFLQDVTIALGRRSLKGIRYAHRTLEFEVTEEDLHGTTSERLDIEARSVTGAVTKITLWEDGLSWLFVARSGAAARPIFKQHANLGDLEVTEVAELLRDTLKDFESVRHLWEKHAVTG